MNRTAATRFLIFALICGAVLSLPGGLLAAAGAPAPGCSHCRDAAPGLKSGCCCSLPGTSGHCGSSGQSGGLACRCGPAGPACLAPAFAATPIWPAASYPPATVTVSSKLLPPNIFHPPEV